jgi:hypothetical protein
MEILPGKLDNLVSALVQTGEPSNLGREADPIALTCEVGAGEPRVRGTPPKVTFVLL